MWHTQSLTIGKVDLQGLPRSSLQLASVACELIAAKHEEVRLLLHAAAPCALRVYRFQLDVIASHESFICQQSCSLETRRTPLRVLLHVQERYPSVSGFTSIADNCFQVRTSRDLRLPSKSTGFMAINPTCDACGFPVDLSLLHSCLCIKGCGRPIYLRGDVVMRQLSAWLNADWHRWVQMKDLIRMEGLVLQSLGFRVNAPTCFTFHNILLRHLQPCAKTAALASYILVCPPPSANCTEISRSESGLNPKDQVPSHHAFPRVPCTAQPGSEGRSFSSCAAKAWRLGRQNVA